VNVADELEKIGFFLHQDRLESVLEKVARTLVATIERNSVAGEDSSHYPGKGLRSRADKEMRVVRHERPCIYHGLPCGKGILEASGHILVVFSRAEQLAPFYAPYHYMMEGAFQIESWFARHDKA
jgi:hypothetical protein